MVNKAANVDDFVGFSSPLASQISLNSIGNQIRRGETWLNRSHPYSDVVQALKCGPMKTSRLGEYVACSAPLHLTDGWNYLSRAFESASRGDRYASYHLAYYAELRAAMSLLATEGIGVFNRQHVALNGNLDAKLFNLSTHEGAWQFLSTWSCQPSRFSTLLEAIVLHSRSLSDWLEEVGVVEPARHVVARDWLRSWSIDLKVVSSDGARRNEMSYRPTRIRAPAPGPVDTSSEIISPLFDSWTELEPSADRAGINLDWSLLRQALKLVTKRGLCTYPSFSATLQHLSRELPDHLFNVLKSESRSAGAILRQASVLPGSGVTATPVLARALLLLRLASACTASLLASASLNKDDLEFWWNPLGRDLGLWDAQFDSESLSDLWTEVGDSKDAAEDTIASFAGHRSVAYVSGVVTEHLSLTQFSRAPMWLLGLD